MTINNKQLKKFRDIMLLPFGVYYCGWHGNEEFHTFHVKEEAEEFLKSHYSQDAVVIKK